MIFHTYRIKLKRLTDGITIIPFACTHWDHPGCHRELFEAFVKRCGDETVYTLGLGDYLDFARATYRTELRRVLPDEDSPQMLDMLVADRVDGYIAVMRKLAPRCIGLIEGNHTWVWMTTAPERGIIAAETSTQYMARHLGVAYLGHTSMVTLEIVFNNSIIDEYILLANHGYGGGGATASADLGKMERQVEPAFDADCYITAHTHRRLVYFLPEMVRSGNGFQEKPHLLVKAGAFLRGYIPDRTTYADRKLLRPLDLGWVEIAISYRRRRDGRYERIVRCILERSLTLSRQ